MINAQGSHMKAEFNEPSDLELTDYFEMVAYSLRSRPRSYRYSVQLASGFISRQIGHGDLIFPSASASFSIVPEKCRKVA